MCKLGGLTMAKNLPSLQHATHNNNTMKKVTFTKTTNHKMLGSIFQIKNRHTTFMFLDFVNKIKSTKHRLVH